MSIGERKWRSANEKTPALPCISAATAAPETRPDKEAPGLVFFVVISLLSGAGLLIDARLYRFFMRSNARAPAAFNARADEVLIGRTGEKERDRLRER